MNTPALPASLRRTNQRTFVSLLMRLGCASRADLAKAAGMSQPTAGKITAELLKLGLLQRVPSEPLLPEGGKARRLGRPGQMLRLDGLRPRFVAIELGVAETSISILPVAVNSEVTWAVRFVTPATAEAWVRELRKQAGGLGLPNTWAVLVSVPGIVDEARGKILFSPNLHWLEKVDVPALVQQAWKAPVILVQEIRALAIGQLATEPGGEDFLLVDFGQGVGGAIVLNGQPYLSTLPLNGEIGHTRVSGNDRVCGCGATGCLETLVSKRGLLESFAASRGASGPQWQDLVSHVAAHPLDSWLKNSLSAAGRVLSGALNVLGLRRVVITGLFSDLPPAVSDYLAGEIARGAMWARFGRILCQTAPRRRAAGLVAAGLDRLILPADEESGLRLPERVGMRKRKRKSAAAKTML